MTYDEETELAHINFSTFYSLFLHLLGGEDTNIVTFMSV